MTQDQVASELHELHGEVSRLRHAVLAAHPVNRHRWLRHVIKSFESDPQVQYRVHLVATYYWLANFPVVALLFFGFPRLWVAVGLLLNTFYSLYANFATDYGAVSAALAAMPRRD